MSRTKKRKAVDAALSEACEASRFPKQIAEVGDDGQRRFEDFQNVMQRGGSVSNLNMSPENLKKIQRVCRALFQRLGDDVREKAASYKERLGGFNWDRWICVKNLRFCQEPQLHKTAEEEEEEEQDDVGTDDDDL
mmetsp:Transcript_9333/g.20839  ORF Transcript_9333/g.20839 Transcript_9333/m.20839 type:complete len:135 (+) Transcript_9333:2-406(+)